MNSERGGGQRAESGDRDARHIACAPVRLEASRLQPGVFKEYGVRRVCYSAQVGVRSRRLEADEARENLVRLRGDLRSRSIARDGSVRHAHVCGAV